MKFILREHLDGNTDAKIKTRIMATFSNLQDACYAAHALAALRRGSAFICVSAVKNRRRSEPVGFAHPPEKQLTKTPEALLSEATKSLAMAKAEWLEEERAAAENEAFSKWFREEFGVWLGDIVYSYDENLRLTGVANQALKIAAEQRDREAAARIAAELGLPKRQEAQAA